MSSTSSPLTSKRKRHFLTLEQKREILSKLDKGETGASLALAYNVGNATITDIKKNKDKILSFVSTSDGEHGAQKRKALKSAQNPVLDKALSEWFTQTRSLGQPISGPILCEKALDLNNRIGGSSDFKASSGFLKNFKTRHGIRELQVQGETLSADSEAAEKFKQNFATIVEEEGYSRDDVYNADETGLNWKSLPTKSLASRRETAAPGFKVSKERITAMTCANAAGTHRLPLLLIGKAKKPRCFKNVTGLPVIYKAQNSAWMDSRLFCDWYTNDFMKNVKEWRKAQHKTGRVLLLLDNAPSHPSAEVLNSLDPDFEVRFLPPNVTSLIQPMDQGVIEKMKRLYRKEVLRRLFMAEENTEDSIVQFAKTINLKHCCYMIADAWASLTERNLKNAWNKLWPPSEETQAEIQEDISNCEKGGINEFVEIFHAIPGFTECDNDDAENWLKDDANDPGYQILTDDQIVSSVLHDEDSDSDDKHSDESVEASKQPSHGEAFGALETAMEWYEKQPECCQTQLLLLKRLRDLAAKKRASVVKQRKIMNFFPKK
ncbi:jerky protein homolog-like [Neodiprion virginianus]|uniref:jerky protein homolog-like n=1 Tax=Neodiprion virginianus TaxID=2961670 RepID=UPI001EE73CBE|nr:jerky protein homolog-like [Neodiprion virginianus]